MFVQKWKRQNWESVVRFGVDRRNGGISKPGHTIFFHPPVTMFRRVSGPAVVAALTGMSCLALFR